MILLKRTDPARRARCCLRPRRRRGAHRDAAERHRKLYRLRLLILARAAISTYRSNQNALRDRRQVADTVLDMLEAVKRSK